MKPETKDTVQYSAAIGTLISGILICFLSFFYNGGTIHESALWYFGESCIFAGGIFGVSLYIRGEVSKLNNKINRIFNEENEEKEEKIED